MRPLISGLKESLMPSLFGVNVSGTKKRMLQSLVNMPIESRPMHTSLSFTCSRYIPGVCTVMLFAEAPVLHTCSLNNLSGCMINGSDAQIAVSAGTKPAGVCAIFVMIMLSDAVQPCRLLTVTLYFSGVCIIILLPVEPSCHR